MENWRLIVQKAEPEIVFNSEIFVAENQEAFIYL